MDIFFIWGPKTIFGDFLEYILFPLGFVGGAAFKVPGVLKGKGPLPPWAFFGPVCGLAQREGWAFFCEAKREECNPPYGEIFGVPS